MYTFSFPVRNLSVSKPQKQTYRQRCLLLYFKENVWYWYLKKKRKFSNKSLYNFYVLKPKNADKYLLVIQKAKLWINEEIRMKPKDLLSISQITFVSVWKILSWKNPIKEKIHKSYKMLGTEQKELIRQRRRYKIFMYSHSIFPYKFSFIL